MRKILKDESGALIIAAIVSILIIAIFTPMVLMYVQNEARWATKQKQSTTAFHLAEAALDRGVWKLKEKSSNWTDAEAGTVIAGYDNDQVYTDIAGGSYKIKFSSGPIAGEVTVVGKAIDQSSNELRAIQGIYQAGAGDFAIQAKNTSSFGAATNVEWGPVVGKNSITTGSDTHPRFFSGGNISPNDINGNASPNSDYIQWWSYKQDLPADPQINFTYYKGLAQGYGTSSDPDCGTYYKTGNFTFKGCTDSGQKVFYVTGDCDFQSGSGGNYIRGDVLCLGDLGITGNGGGYQNIVATVPATAWQEYGNDWAYYKTNFDPTCPYATYAAASSAGYLCSGKTYTISGALLWGFLYTGGSQGLTGGGNARILGTLISANNTSMSTSNCTLYFDPDVASNVKLSNVIISRLSWKELAMQSW